MIAKYFVLRVALGIVFTVTALAQAPVAPPPVPPKIDYSAPPMDQVVEFVPSNAHATQNPVRLMFKGWLYMPEGLSFAAPDSVKFPAEEHVVMDALAASKKDGIQAVVPFWSPAEQAAIRKTVTDPQTSAGMTSFLRSVENSVFLAKILYGQYSIVIVMHIGASLPSAQAPARYTLKKVNDRFYLTDDLSADPVFGYFAEKYSKQLVSQITGKQF